MILERCSRSEIPDAEIKSRDRYYSDRLNAGLTDHFFRSLMCDNYEVNALYTIMLCYSFSSSMLWLK